MSKTVKEHFAACKQVSEVIDDANALLTKCRDELHKARIILEMIGPYQHPKLEVPIGCNGWISDQKNMPPGWISDEKYMPPSTLIEIEIKRINALLGDRA